MTVKTAKKPEKTETLADLWPGQSVALLGSVGVSRSDQ